MISQTALILVLLSSTVILGITDISCDTERPIKGSNTTCKCITSNNIEWQLNDVILSQCTTTGICSPILAGYVFQTNTSSPDTEYSLTVEEFGYSSCKQYSCTDTNTFEEKKKQLSIAVFDSTSPSVFVEPGNNKNGNIEITTECLFKESDIMVEWYYVTSDNATAIQYTPDAPFKTSTNCTETCNGKPAVKLNIGFNHTEDESNLTQTVKFVLKVYHKEYSANVLDLKTSFEYKIKATTATTDDSIVNDVIKAVCIPFTAFKLLGIILASFFVYTAPFFCCCFYYWKCKCCCKCVWNVCDCCRNCNVKGLPCLYRILWLSVIGIPVALGILSVWIVYRIWCKNAIRYVLITYDGISNKNDESVSLGAPVGAVCLTKVTARGKLKVGDQMNKINGITVTGEKQNQILAMLNDKENLTLDVSQVGSVSTTDSVVELKREQLGFEYEYIAMVTNVTEGSKAEGKMEKGDLILSINGKSTAGKSNAEVNKELKKPEVMELSIKRGEDKKKIKLDLKGKASLGIAIEKEGENIVVSDIEPQSAAAAAKISGEIKVGDYILCVNGVRTAGLKFVEIEEMLSISIILKVTKDVTLKELDPDKDGSFGFETFLPSTSTSVTFNKQTTVTSVTPDSQANVVKSVTTNGPAAHHGIKSGDKIVSINGKETKGKSHQEIKAMLETFGTSISLKIEKGIPCGTSGHEKDDVLTYENVPDSKRTLPPIKNVDKKNHLLGNPLEPIPRKN